MDILDGVTDEGKSLLAAGVEMVGRTGAKSFQIRYCEEEEPIIWMGVAEFDHDGETIWETAAAMSPVRAILRLCERLIDGSICTHCKRPAGFEPDDITSMPANDLFCWYQYDPELKTFRRGCEGDDR